MFAGNTVKSDQIIFALKNDKTGQAANFIASKPCLVNLCDACLLGLTYGITALLTCPCRLGYCSSCMRNCGCWCPFSGTPLYWAVYYKKLPALKAIVEYGADLGIKLTNGENVVEYAEKYEAPVEIINYLKHAIANPTPGSATMGRYADSILSAIGRKHKKYAAFLTHHKRDAAAVVGSLRNDICARLDVDPSYVFLDSENLRDLRGLRDAVRDTLVLIVVLTKDVFTRPWCLVEIYTAIEMQIPIISINIEGQGNAFNFQETQKYLQAEDFPAQLESVNPGASKELLSQEIDPAALGQKVGGFIPYIIAKSYNVSASERVRDAQLGDIVDVLMEKI